MGIYMEFDEAIAETNARIDEIQELLNGEIRDFDINEQTSIDPLIQFSDLSRRLTDSEAWTVIRRHICSQVIESQIDDQSIKDEIVNRFGYIDSPPKLLQILGNNPDNICHSQRRWGMRPGGRLSHKRTEKELKHFQFLQNAHSGGWNLKKDDAFTHFWTVNHMSLNDFSERYSSDFVSILKMQLSTNQSQFAKARGGSQSHSNRLARDFDDFYTHGIGLYELRRSEADFLCTYDINTDVSRPHLMSRAPISRALHPKFIPSGPSGQGLRLRGSRRILDRIRELTFSLPMSLQVLSSEKKEEISVDVIHLLRRPTESTISYLKEISSDKWPVDLLLMYYLVDSEDIFFCRVSEYFRYIQGQEYEANRQDRNS